MSYNDSTFDLVINILKVFYIEMKVLLFVTQGILLLTEKIKIEIKILTEKLLSILNSVTIIR